eukprot:Phypoly_transcript_09949.p1 GENE.Phypoly_transcript_09949~~Phypoly_transcript_09949.p1  ORF type:complete len:447 (+),score=75.52 Phypoly_transcript_09949:66-1343(+)
MRGQKKKRKKATNSRQWKFKRKRGMAIPRRYCIFGVSIGIVILFSVFYFDFEILSLPDFTDGEDDSDLKCASAIKEYLASSDKFEPAVKDLLLLIAEYALLQKAQRKFIKKSDASVVPATHFKDPESLKKKLTTATCLNDGNLKPQIAICTYQGSTAEYAQEWVSHYLLLGVSKIYLYNSNPKNGEEKSLLEKVLDPFAQLGYVEIIPWNGKKQQPAVKNCAKITKDYDWVSFLDADEYLLINNNKSTCLTEFLREFVDKTRDKPPASIALRWRNMVSLGVPHHNISQTLLAQELYAQNANVILKKHIAFVKGMKSYAMVHKIENKPGYYFYDASGRNVSSDPWWNAATEEDYQDLELRHFWSMSLDFLLFDKVCGSTRERENNAHTRVGMAFEPFEKNAVLKKLSPSQHQPVLHEFLFGSHTSQ